MKENLRRQKGWKEELSTAVKRQHVVTSTPNSCNQKRGEDVLADGVVRLRQLPRLTLKSDEKKEEKKKREKNKLKFII